MKRVLAAAGWTVGLQVLWGFVQVVLVLWLGDKQWIGDNFLAAPYRRTPGQVPGLIDEIVTAMLYAAAITFLVGLIASLLWVVISGLRRIYVPGQAAQLRGLWLTLLILGAFSCGGAAWWLLDGTRLVLLDGTIKSAIAAGVLFVISYYVVGTLWSTVAKIRPAVPLAVPCARLLKVG
jgi:hypothetical protein